MSNLTDIPLTTIAGTPATLADYSGKVLLLVNVASKCGLTPQYTALEALYQQFKDRGFAVLGFPANDFAGQEPGSNEEIAKFCSTEYPVTFPLFSKITVTGQASAVCRADRSEAGARGLRHLARGPDRLRRQERLPAAQSPARAAVEL
jgi:glutathione peroxidase-family protein